MGEFEINEIDSSQSEEELSDFEKFESDGDSSDNDGHGGLLIPIFVREKDRRNLLDYEE